ncbi:MAG: EF2563 family selenium-dependent molybdenum hydroxylase system protein [Planctomycetota bacterium]|nr:MAG: EF2563 family selenium-dependent molybdenum hydroxylase system protein [Planctomycetota bacterium]
MKKFLDKLDPVLVRGAGDVATGVAHRLFHAGFKVVCTEIEKPLTVRRAVAFSEAVYEGRHTVEGVEARRRAIDEVHKAFADGVVPVVVDPDTKILEAMSFLALVDARMTKRPVSPEDAPVVIGLGPGFTAGENCHAWVETLRGHNLGRVGYSGCAIADTGVPGERGGFTDERVLRAPSDGVFEAVAEIGDRVEAGVTVARVGDSPVEARIGGYVRGMLHGGLKVTKGLKVGDIDAAAEHAHCFTISDRANAIAGGVLEAVLRLGVVKTGGT